MAARQSLKAIMLSIMGASLWAGSSTFAWGQQWDSWDAPRRPPAQAYSRDDDRYGDVQDEDRYDDDRAGARVDNRYYDPDNDPRRYDPRYNADRDDDGYTAGQPYPGPRAYGRGYSGGRRYDDRDDYGAWDAAPSPDEEARLSKSQGASGGARPYIRAVAPPKVAFSGSFAPGSIVIDTSARKLYYVLSSSSAYAYSIGVGRQGFAWTGKEKVSRVADWPDWYPPADMRRRRPELPARMLGGIRNPLGAKAIYLGNTLYRIHGTNEPKSIGKAESSGCFRMLNENVLHLASLVHVGTEVTVVRSLNGRVASAGKTSTRPKTPEKEKATPRQPDRRPTNTAPTNTADDVYDPYNGWH